jgi:hypothetical protein
MAALKWPRDSTMLGSSMRRVGLIDITVGNATRLGASQRSAKRRCASHHIATQRLSRWGSPAARARLARMVPLKRLWHRDGHVKRNTCERSYGAPFSQQGRAVAANSTFYAAALRVARFGSANEQADWETAHHVFTYANAVHGMLARMATAEETGRAEAVRGQGPPTELEMMGLI